MPPTEAKRRNRWRQEMPMSTASSSYGVEPATTSPSSQSNHGEHASPRMAVLQRKTRQSPRKPTAVKSKAVKPRSSAQKAAEQLPSIPQRNPPQLSQSHSRVQTCGHTGLVGLAAAVTKEEVAADPNMPEPHTCDPVGDPPTSRGDVTAEIYLHNDLFWPTV